MVIVSYTSGGSGSEVSFNNNDDKVFCKLFIPTTSQKKTRIFISFIRLLTQLLSQSFKFNFQFLFFLQKTLLLFP